MTITDYNYGDDASAIITAMTAAELEQALACGRLNIGQINYLFKLALDGLKDLQDQIDGLGAGGGSLAFTSTGGNYTHLEGITATGYTATATAAAGGAITFTLTGPDAALFAIDGNTGVVTWLSAPVFATPNDTGSDGTYEFVVTASEAGGGSVTQNVSVTPTSSSGAPAAPVFAAGASVSITHDASSGQGTGHSPAATANGGAGAAIAANTYTLGGADADDFTISAGGELEFVSPLNVNAPTDADSNNSYTVTITATDPTNGAVTATQTVTVSVYLPLTFI